MTRGPVAAIQTRAAELGFEAVGIARAAAPADAARRLAEFLAAGHHGSMEWLVDADGRRADPQVLWPAARSIVMLGANYAPDGDPMALLALRRQGVVSAYARRRDYHDVVKGRLKQLAGWMAARLGGEVKVFVDTAPVMEKPLAAAAGIGWQGKHTNLVSATHGSWLFLGAVFTTLDLEPDAPHADRCGSCTRCLDICPTGAFPAPYRLDARRCIAYLTIELRGPIPRPLRPAIGHRLFGCDICQTVCPWNLRWERADSWPELAPRAEVAELTARELCTMTQEAFSLRFRGSPLKRTKRAGLVRNAAVVLGNAGDRGNLALLGETLQSHDEPLVRGHAAWAIGRLGGATAALLLERARAMEEDLYVRDEIAAAEASR